MLKQPKNKISELLAQFHADVNEGVKESEVTPFVPTGALEDAIIKIGEFNKPGKTLIINLQCANKLGKTAIAAVIARNIVWDNDPEYFDYPVYKKWPFTANEYDENGELVKIGEPVKRFRIVGTAQNTDNSGPIKTEISKWWPTSRYNCMKGGKGYDRIYETDTGWDGDVLTFNQDPDEFEGPLISFHWIDEPPKPQLVGAFTSRHMHGGVLLFTQTPLNAGPMIDVLKDFQEKGATVITVTATLHDNCIKTGKLNSKGTKRGLMTPEAIKDYISLVPLDEVEARVYGKSLGKSGKLYPNFDKLVHVRDFDLNAPSTKLWNCYTVMDPHDKYYPFIQWWAITPPNDLGISKHVLYNEWPTYASLRGNYDELRNRLVCKLGPEDVSSIIKLLDGQEFGLNVVGRIIDPQFAKNHTSDYSKKSDGIVMEYQRHGIIFNYPPLEKIQVQRDNIRKSFKYNIELPVSKFNEPDMFIMPHCLNSIRAFERHYWEDGKEVESETFKDPCDCARMYRAFVANKPWEPVRQAPKKRNGGGLMAKAKSHLDKFTGHVKSIGLH